MCEDMSVRGRPPRGMMKQGRERPRAKALRWYGGKKVHEAGAKCVRMRGQVRGRQELGLAGQVDEHLPSPNLVPASL